MSILMFSTNQKCNALAAVMGMFFHSTSTPELVIEVCAHAGLSVSITTIHNMVDSLSKSASEALRKLAKTKSFAFAYDNFDMDFKGWASTIENAGDTLKHATSALAFPLQHGVLADDLKYATPLWIKNPRNPTFVATPQQQPYTWMNTLSPPSSEELGRYNRILAWHFRRALIEHCSSFEHFRSQLGLPETILQIPVTKTTHIPCRAMDINQSTVDGQAEILESLFSQANIGDPTDYPDVEDVREYVIVVHGDLGTGERLEGSLGSRAIERKPIRGLQNIVFAPGLFHLQMACGDAIWRMYIEPKSLRAEPNGLYQQACKIRPYESGRIGSKPGFRLMHDVILQCATARMLDIWRVEIKIRMGESLEQYAARTTWSELEKISSVLVDTYVDKPSAKDQEFRNNSLILGRLLSYVELTHAMKHGDIGRVEATFLEWVPVFKSVGKHKYANQLVKTLIDFQHVYPPRLS
jgi:hypothetical protein